jgi:hypothetical protein
MSHPSSTTGDQLANALHTLGVNFIMSAGSGNESLHKQPTLLIAALAKSEEARLRLSLIPLFLEHPEFAAHVHATAKELDPPARLTLQCYYSAAIWLGQKYRTRLNSLIGEKAPLPDHFSSELGVQVTNDPEANLKLLAERHQELGGAQVNWLGTYQHAAQVWIKGLELQAVE